MKTLILICVSLIAVMLVGLGCATVEVVYTTEYVDDSCIKFEDAMYEVEPDDWVEACLGEDGAENADLFFITLDNTPEPEDIVVKVKAGKCTDDEITLSEESSFPYDYLIGEDCDFTILFFPGYELDELLDDLWVLVVISDDDDRTPALSHVTFCVDNNTIILGPPEGENTVIRILGESD